MTTLRPTIRSYVSSSPAFFCPACGGDRIGDVCDGRRRLVIGSLAVAPWTRAGDHVRCTSCDAKHPSEVLAELTSADLAARLVDLTRVLTVLIVRTGEPQDRDLRRRAVQHVRTVLPGYHQNRLDVDMAALDPATVSLHVTPVAAALAVSGKERLVASMVQVALAAHTISSHQRWLLTEAGTAFGLTPIHVTGIISATAASIEPNAEDPADRA